MGEDDKYDGETSSSSCSSSKKHESKGGKKSAFFGDMMTHAKEFVEATPEEHVK